MFDRAAYCREYSRKRRLTLKAEGRCFDCKDLLQGEDKGRARCSRCREIHKTRQFKRKGTG